MKKITVLFTAVACAVAVLSSCTKDSISISQKGDLAVGPDATEINVTVQASADWSVDYISDVNENWVNITKGADSFRINISSNKGTAERTCTITVNCGTASQSFNLTQSSLIANLAFTAPDTISYDINGTVEGGYATGIFGKAEFESYATDWNEGDSILSFIQAVDGFMASSDIQVLDEAATVTWKKKTVSFALGFVPSVEIKAGGEYIIVVAPKVACENNDKTAPFYFMELKAE